MTYTLTFSHIVEGKRLPLTIDGKEVTLPVDATDRTSAINSQEVKTFIEGLADKVEVRVRRVL